MKSGAEPKILQAAGQGVYRNIPKQAGGRLIRETIASLRQAEVTLPLNSTVLDSQILIACSGGLDSTALAVLIAKYGQKIAQGVSILHINHGWRGHESDQDAQFVEALARKLDVNCIVERLDPQAIPAGESWENHARQERKRLYEKYAGERGFVLTGHQADEQCETLLWRLFTGATHTHGAGIGVQEGRELRPLLDIWKTDLRAFLEEEGISWREDATNRDERFLRASIRENLEPELTRLFPRWKHHLLALSRGSRGLNDSTSNLTREVLASWFGSAGLRMRRVHWQTLQRWLEQIQDKKPPTASRSAAGSVLDRLTLPSGWEARLERKQNSNSLSLVIEQPEVSDSKGPSET
ncbi:MAG: hypothetical protein RJB38_1614 [Pseudomonadota bacterium]|jgi:tRNA(Ile)-lysidine synthetase-like protein